MTDLISPFIAVAIIEEAIREEINKPEGELTEADFEKVNKLNLSYSLITDAGLKEFSKVFAYEHKHWPNRFIHQIKFLDLRETNISDAGLKELSNLKGLRELILIRCPVITTEGLAELKKALPNCEIVGPNCEIVDLDHATGSNSR